MKNYSRSAIVQQFSSIEDVDFYYRKLIAAMPNNVYWLDKYLKGVGCNDNTLKLLGLRTIDEFFGISYEKMAELSGCTLEQAIQFKAQDAEVIKTGIAKINIEEKISVAEREFIYFLTSRVPLFDKQNNVIGVLGISTDITERKKLEKNFEIAKEKAETANQAKTEFLKNIRHDVRTPLTGIVGCAEALLSQTTDPKVIEYAADLVKSSNALLGFHNRVLEGLQIATGEIPLVKTKFDLRKQLEEIIDLNRSLAAEKKLALNLDYDDTIPRYLVGDPVRVQRIVLELIANALMFTQQGEVNLIVQHKGKKDDRIIIEILVSDTGIGVPKDKQKEIFLRFKRLTPSYKGIYKGLGLGLTTVKQFMDDLKGNLHVDSNVGKGSTFVCRIAFEESLLMDDLGVEEVPIPEIYNLSKKEELAEDTAYQLTGSLGTIKNRILLVEDNDIAAKVAESALKILDCTVDRAPDGKTTMELLQKHTYQLVLMDIGLPDTDGIALTYRIRLQDWQNSHATVPIVGLTAHIDSNDKQRCLNAGMNMVILKPLRSEKAKELLEYFVQKEALNETWSTNLAPISGPVVDFEEAKRISQGDKGLVENCRKLMVTELTVDLAKIAAYYQVGDWDNIYKIAHKCKGSASYLAAKRLEQITQYFGEAWYSGKKEKLDRLYQQLVQEMEAVKEVCENCKPD